jgi:hypothetical protein
MDIGSARLVYTVDGDDYIYIAFSLCYILQLPSDDPEISTADTCALAAKS